MPSSRLYAAALRGLHMTGLDRMCAPLARGAGAIFMLHHVRPAEQRQFTPNSILEITPEFLETVIKTVIEEGFDLVSLDEAAERLEGDVRHERPFACFTFDDGYRDNRDYAYPICRSYGVPMTVYVAGDYADGRGRLWWLTLEDVIRQADRLVVDMDGERDFDCRSDDAKTRTFEAVYWWLRGQPDTRIHTIVDGLAARFGIDPMARCRELVMGWDELRTFAACPLVTIGAHTLSHSALAKLPEDEARREMAASIARVETEIGQPCRHFSYPYGDRGSAGPREFALAAELGVRTASTTAKGMVSRDGAASPLALKRFSLNGDYQDEQCLNALLTGVPFAAWNWAFGPDRAWAPGNTPAALS